jgi:ferredoxin
VVADTVEVDYFCRRGECATCVQTVVEGTPLHKDSVLSDRARANGKIIICVSRSLSDRLVLDL